MRRDPTEFRERFKAYKEGKMPYENGRPKAIQKVDESNADFAKRLRSNWRLEIWDWKGSGKSVTHKIAGADNIVYPNVQTTKGGGLIDFTHPIWKDNVDPYRRAIKNNDYVPMDSEQDAKWFGPNYKDYYPGFKNGKLPKYSTGTESWLPDYTMDYILALENPTRQGFNNGVWRPPTDSSKWDTHAIGGGLDIRYENNPLVYNFLSKNGRLNDPYLTEQEETDLRWLIFNRDMLPILSKVHDKYGEQISPKGYARLAGMKWQGHPFLMAITPDSITGKAFLNAIASGDRDLDSVFDTYYLYPANAKKYASRIQSDKDYWEDTKLERTKYNIPEPTIKRHVEVPDRTAVRKTVSKSKTRARWSGAEEVSPYITGKPMLKLQKEVKLPNVIEENKKSLWKPKMLFKDGKLPRYEDGKSIIDFIKNKLYTNVSPVDYDIPKAILEFFSGEREYGSGVKEALWAKYLGRNTYTDYAGEKNVNDVIVPAIYSPTKGESTYTAYRINPDIFDYSYSGTAGGPLSNENIKAYFLYRNKTGKNNFTVDTKNGFTGDGNAGMGYYTMGSGQDEKGRYISYYDDWDINPFHGNTARSWTKILPSWIKDRGDILLGTLDTKPFTLYDRRYLTDEEWKSLGGYKNGKLPLFRKGKGDGMRYLWDDKSLLWDRVTNDAMMRAFADLTVTPSGNREDTRTNPIYHDPRLRSAGYVTQKMLEDEANAIIQRETGSYAPGLELVNPEFDLLLMGAGSRINPLTQRLHQTRSLAKQMDRVFNEGLVGATKDMPVFKASDMYNPEHFRSTVKYNPKQIEVKTQVGNKKHAPSNTGVERVLNIPQSESENILALPQEEYIVPEASYTGRVPTRSYNLRDLLKGAGSNIIRSSGEVLNPTTPEQRPVIPQKLLPLNKRSEYVDSEGNVNMRNVVKAVRKFYANHPEARNYKEIMNLRDVPGVGQQQRNLYLHINDVVKSAQQAPVPEGFTRQNLVQAALFHDIGKVLNPDKSHGETSVDILKELGIHAPYDVKHAIKRHMSHHLGDEDPLTKALHFVDVVRDTQPMTNTGAYDTFRNLLYPSNLPYKIRPLYSWDYDWLLNNIINPILREYGYDEIPLGLSKEETRKLVLDRALEHRTFARGLHTFNSDNLRNATNLFVRREGRLPTEEELFDQGFEYYKEHRTTSGDRGAEEYMRKFELPYKKYMSLYTSNSDEVYRGYLRQTAADYAARALQLPVQDNPNWSLAELWGYNDYPLVYSPGGTTPEWRSTWRYQRLPSILNFGNDATPSVLTLREADVINARNRSQAANIAHEKAKLEVVAGVDNGEYKNAPKYYQTKPSYYMEATSKPDVQLMSAPFERFAITKPIEPSLGNYFGKNIIGYSHNPFAGNTGKTLSDAVIKLNEYLRENGVKEVMPYAYSLLQPRKKDLLFYPSNPNSPINAKGYRNTVIKYPVALNNLLNKIEFIKVNEGGDIPAHIPVLLDRHTKKPKPASLQYRGMSVKQIEAHNNANKPRVNKDGVVVNTPLFIPDPWGPNGGYYVASNTKYVPDIKKIINDAVRQYYKDIKLSKSRDAFIRRKLHQNDLNMFIKSESAKLFDKYYIEPELVKPDKLAQQIDYPFTTQSFDGYRVFVTENNYDPGSGYLNNYILVGPRGARAASINRKFNLDIDNHGYTRGHDNIGKPVKGLTKNAM